MSPDIQTIPAQDLSKKQSCLILDVRTDVEHKEACLQQKHLHIPLDQLDVGKFMNEHKLQADQTLYLLCKAGGRATKAAAAFKAAGIENVCVIEGGITACTAAGQKIKTLDVVSLERQVRMVVGATVLLSVILGSQLHAGFYALAGIMGAGLLFAGVTDWCGMALLLARMPWNKDQKACQTKSH